MVTENCPGVALLFFLQNIEISQIRFDYQILLQKMCSFCCANEEKEKLSKKIDDEEQNRGKVITISHGHVIVV